ncbi:NEAT domain-containing protein [Weissella ceti]|uniref:NEAT domain-containing protein n=2 Tax=Weissella ceti TaxID=759620 RepID=A0ABT3E271_9LACO|nr:NEAT domain-containing protein [Weissella ceti]MCW0952519.1 NEAT domain-containing protein [Weissella ceti]
MNIKKNILITLFLAISALFVGVPITSANTQTVPLSVLKEGTNQTSYAASYFSNVASVTPLGNGQYTITSSVTTNKSLGNYPVQIMSINGGAANTSKSANGQTQTITYSFQTNNLSARQNAVIKVDVDSINYHHVYNVGLQIDASSIKEPTQMKSTKKMTTREVASQADKQAKKQEITTSKRADMSSTEKTKAMSELSDVETKKASSEHEPAKKESAFGYSTNKKSADSQAKESRMTERSKQNHAAKKSDVTNKILIFIGSGLAVGILAAGAVIWFTSRKK